MSALYKGRVTISGVAVIEGERTLGTVRNTYNHVLDGHLFAPNIPGGDVLCALRHFNTGEPLRAPWAYYVTAQIAAMPLSLPNEVSETGLIAPGLRPQDYNLLGDVKQIIPYGNVERDNDEPVVDALIPPYVFASGSVADVRVTQDCISFKMHIEQYVAPLGKHAQGTITIYGGRGPHG